MNRGYLQDAHAVSTFSTRVYGWMALGLGVTASLSYFLFTSGLYRAVLPFSWLVGLALFGIAFGLSARMHRLSMGSAMALFLTYAALEGVLFGSLLPLFAAAYGGQVIWSAFLTASLVFIAAMGYGMLTKNDLSSVGRLLSFGLVALMGITLLYLVLSFFCTLPRAYLFISYLGLVIFVGLTSYDAQTIRRMSLQVDVHSVASHRLALVMALRMYMNVIMVFWYLLQIFSLSRKS